MEITSNTVMIITGCTRGFGRALVREYAALGAKIFGTYVSSDERAREIETKYPNVKMSKVDSTDVKAIQNFVDEVIKKEGKIDILINNAGSIQERKNLVDLSIQNFKNLLDVHVLGYFVYIKSVLPHMLKQNSGVIVNVASRFGLFEWAKEGFGALNVAKAGVNMITKVLAKEIIDTGIRVNSILPAPTITNFLTTVFSKEELDFMDSKGILGTMSEFVDQVNKAIKEESLNGEFILSQRLK